MTYPSGLVLAYSFDSVGRINQIVATPSGGGAATVLSSATYHPFGGVQGWTFGNSQTYARTYDLDGRVSGFTLAGTAMSLSFDAASRITGQTWFPNSTNSVTYGYDNWDRLTSTITPNTTYGFAYDANSNRTSKTVGVNTWTYAYPGSSNKLSSITKGTTATYTHDANGSITADGTNTFSYGVRGRMTGATTLLGAVTYRYNALGQRYLKTLSGTTTVYLYDDAGHLIAETSNAGSSYTEYLWLGDTPVATIKPGSAAIYYIHTDHLDTPRLIADQTPTTVWRWDNDDPFGANMANGNPTGLGMFVFNVRLPGQYLDQETNSHYNYYRDYSTETGRYIQSDPIGIHGGPNSYAYVNSSPMLYTDPRGLHAYPWKAGPNFNPNPCPCPQVPSSPPGASCPANIQQATNNQWNPSWLYSQVQNKGPWDYKQQGSQYQDFGNFNYGATAAASNIPASIIYRGAGWAQGAANTSSPQWGTWWGSYPYGDDPADQYWIAQGIQYYRCGCYKN
ncbi:MAG TPA: RHS repeat-associated core domain-containing protein [Burkholderiales bacterium]|nr:RHS repeat-associated core domain-containing protein [Burkholderiales bacterium]